MDEFEAEVGKMKLGSQRLSCRGQVGGVGGDRVEGLDKGVGEG